MRRGCSNRAATVWPSGRYDAAGGAPRTGNPAMSALRFDNVGSGRGLRRGIAAKDWGCKSGLWLAGSKQRGHPRLGARWGWSSVARRRRWM